MTTVALCACGCGAPAPLATTTCRSRGLIKGHPKRFIHGHNARGQKRVVGERRIIRKGYVMLRMREHPHADDTGYVYEHIAVAERALGKPLPSGAIVHHVDEVKTNNSNSNLAILQDTSYHLELHQRLRVLRAGGNPWTQRLCRPCNKPKDFSEFNRTSEKWNRRFSSYCKDCRRDADRRRRTA